MEEKRRRGRPARPPEPGERVPMSFRVTPEFKTKLDRAAYQSGRSLAQEIEQRLETSLQAEGRLGEALDAIFGEPLSALLMLLAEVMDEVWLRAYVVNTYREGQPVRIDRHANWLLDPFIYDQVVSAVSTVLEAFRPEGDRLPDHIAASGNIHMGSKIGVNTAGSFLAKIADRDAEDPVRRIGSKTREKLGDAVVDRLLRNVGVPDLAERPSRRKRGAQPRQSPSRKA